MGRLVSVNIGLPRDVSWRGETVHTAVWKQPVQGRRMVGRLNVDGDGQGDLAGHGGEYLKCLPKPHTSALELGDSSQRHRVHAITQAARGWSVGEDVAQVGVTSVANGFDPLQKRRPVKEVGNHILLYGLGE